MRVDLGAYDNRGYNPGAGLLKRGLWYVVNAMVFHSWLLPHSPTKSAILRWFGATVGAGAVIKPRVNIKYPWHLTLGHDVWIGEGAWLDNLDDIIIESNVCISQDAYLLTGNHDYSDPNFGLITKPIVIEEGAWVGARAVVCPGVRLGHQTVLSVGSVLSQDAAPKSIYRGNPAERVRARQLRAGIHHT